MISDIKASFAKLVLQNASRCYVQKEVQFDLNHKTKIAKTQNLVFVHVSCIRIEIALEICSQTLKYMPLISCRCILNEVKDIDFVSPQGKMQALVRIKK